MSILRRQCGQGLITAAGVALLAGFLPPAQAYDDNVASNCRGDYISYCLRYSPESENGRACMREHRADLSQRCKQALVDSGEAARPVARKTSDRR